MQGYNAQAVTTREQIVLAAEVTITSSDATHLAPMITAACEELHAAGVTEPPEIVVADAGYWNRPHIEHLVNQGIQTLSCVPRHSSAPRPGQAAMAVYTRSCAASLKATPATRTTSSARQ
jgi:hypothetical protein